MGYENEPSYGNENFDHKVVTVTLKTPLTKAQVDDLFDNAPQLDEKFPDYGYTDGEKNGASFSHGWEKTDVVPRALINYDISRTEIRVSASEAVSTADFIEAVRNVLAESAKTVNASVAAVNTSGIAVGYSGSTLAEVGASISVASRQFKGPARKPGMQP